MTTQYRFYSFVAALYISPLQCGLQTAHAVSRMHADLLLSDGYALTNARLAYDDWAKHGQTIIICSALNSAGVEAAYERLAEFGRKLDLPTSIFFEDKESLNCAATAAAIVVPEKFYDAKPTATVPDYPGFWRSLFEASPQIQKSCRYTDPDGNTLEYPEGSVEYDFVTFLKSYRLA